MEKRNAYDLIYIGLTIRHLMWIKPEFDVKRVINLFDNLEGKLKRSGLQVSLSGFSNFLGPIKLELKTKAKDEKIGENIKKQVIENIMKIEDIVTSEATMKNIYVIPQRRFNGEYLARKPMELLGKGIFEKLPEMAVFDFAASCRCLLYGEGTASAFHILRATEEVLKHFYFKYKKTNRLEKPMWSPMTSEMRAKRRNRPNDMILNSLDLVRTSYRNPTQHPDAKYDIESAQDLFGVCIDLINKMAIELEPK